MSVTIIADPGACWKVPGDSERNNLDRCIQMIWTAKQAGVQAIKFQLLRQDMYPAGSKEAQLVADYELPGEWLPTLSHKAHDVGLLFGCTVYRPEDVVLVEPWVDFHKVASFEFAHRALLKTMLTKSTKPIYFSLGMGHTLHEWAIERAELHASPIFARAYERVTWLHCVSAYPAQPARMNLRRIAHLPPKRGLSDHTTGYDAAMLAVALGAVALEKHLRANDTPESNPDYAHSLDPVAMHCYVEAVQDAEAMLGSDRAIAQPGELVQYQWNPETGKRGTV